MEEINLDKVTIFQALPMIMLEFGGMKKMTAQERMDRGLVTDTGITYSYRGIDQLAGKVQPLFGKYRISIFVNVTSYTSVPYMRKTKFGESQWYRDEVAVEYTLADQFGTKVVNCVRGIGDDNSDKGYNKAMTNSFKNLLLRILCIGDPQDDIDNNQNQYYNQFKHVSSYLSNFFSGISSSLSKTIELISSHRQSSVGKHSRKAARKW